jgi:hypothetical protein
MHNVIYRYIDKHTTRLKAFPLARQDKHPIIHCSEWIEDLALVNICIVVKYISTQNAFTQKNIQLPREVILLGRTRITQFAPANDSIPQHESWRLAKTCK